jgi:hypothetical protein
MEPVSMTLGTIAAAVYAKAQERAVAVAVEGGEGVVHRLVRWLRTSLSDSGDTRAIGALELVERAPDSRSSVDALAVVLNDRANDDVDFQSQLAALVNEARHDRVAGGFVTEVYGNARVAKIVNIGRAGDVSL